MLWKGLLESVFEDLLRFIFPDVDKELDLSRGVEFLDKELTEMFPEPDRVAKGRVVDKLVKIYTRDGMERSMLLHLEVQGAKGNAFAKRMFQYYYRLLDRYDRPVSAIAIFTGRSGDKMPARFEDRCLGTHLLYQFNTFCVFDRTDEELKASDNPFALVVLVAKQAFFTTKGSDQDYDNYLLEQKTLIFKLLEEKKTLSPQKIRAIRIFLNNYIRFKLPETNRIFMQRVDQITGITNTMGIEEQLAEIKAGEALVKGLRKGRQQGREKTVRLVVENLLRSTRFSVKRVAELAAVTPEFVSKIKAEMDTK